LHEGLVRRVLGLVAPAVAQEPAHPIEHLGLEVLEVESPLTHPQHHRRAVLELARSGQRPVAEAEDVIPLAAALEIEPAVAVHDEERHDHRERQAGGRDPRPSRGRPGRRPRLVEVGEHTVQGDQPQPHEHRHGI
jgi:hypothetical protein